MAFNFETPMAPSRPVSLHPTSAYESSIQHVLARQRPPACARQRVQSRTKAL